MAPSIVPRYILRRSHWLRFSGAKRHRRRPAKVAALEDQQMNATL